VRFRCAKAAASVATVAAFLGFTCGRRGRRNPQICWRRRELELRSPPESEDRRTHARVFIWSGVAQLVAEEEELGRGFVLGFEGVGKPEEELEWSGEETGRTMDCRQ
jgi:hypothetical protein